MEREEARARKLSKRATRARVLEAQKEAQKNRHIIKHERYRTRYLVVEQVEANIKEVCQQVEFNQTPDQNEKIEDKAAESILNGDEQKETGSITEGVRQSNGDERGGIPEAAPITGSTGNG